jgi:hypothetical protein
LRSTPPRPRLSVVCLTANSETKLERWSSLVREYADELVIAVDDVSTDNTAKLARKLADRIAIFEHPPPPTVEVARDVALRMATGEWILVLDDDELMAGEFQAVVEDLLADTYLTHYLLPYRWLVPLGEGDFGWIRTFPWHPDPRLRLFRNIGSIFGNRGLLHCPPDVAGAGRVLSEPSTVIYHLDLALHDRAAREAKVAQYKQGNAPTREEFYLWEDYRATLDIVPVTDTAVALAVRPETDFSSAMGTRLSLELPYLTASEQRASSAKHDRAADLFHADYLSSTTPQTVLPNRGYNAEVRVRNTSKVQWRTTGLTDGRVVLSHHWVHREHGTLLRDGDTATLPYELNPGEEVAIEAGFWTPYDPGFYQLEWDLRAEGLNWFSERGTAPLVVEIEVLPDDDRPTKMRAVAAHPLRASSGQAAIRGSNRRARPGSRRRFRRVRSRELIGANLVAIPPCRVLDTRDGTGFPGAPRGPIPGGSVVTLRVVGLAGIPDTAVGIVGTLCILEADYNGYVTVSPADGTVEVATVSAYFYSDQPSATQVLAALGRGAHAGQLCLKVSANHPGHIQMLLEVTGYLD